MIAATAKTNRRRSTCRRRVEIIAGTWSSTRVQVRAFLPGRVPEHVCDQRRGHQLFLGGWREPVAALAWVPSYVWFAVKLSGCIAVFIWLRGTMPGCAPTSSWPSRGSSSAAVAGHAGSGRPLARDLRMAVPRRGLARWVLAAGDSPALPMAEPGLMGRAAGGRGSTGSPTEHLWKRPPSSLRCWPWAGRGRRQPAQPDPCALCLW